MNPPPLLPIDDPISGGVGYCVQAVEGRPYGFQFGPHWFVGVDVKQYDMVLAYCRTATELFGPGDMLRICPLTRRWNFGAVIDNPSGNAATFTFTVNADTKAGIEVRATQNTISQFDALRLDKGSDADRQWIHFAQGDGKRSWRIGYVDGELHFYYADGKESSPERPGRKMMRLDARGNLWLHGIVKENTLP